LDLWLSRKAMSPPLSYDIVGCAIAVHKELGPGLLESVYKKCLIHELKLNGFDVKSQVFVPVNYRNMEIDAQLKLDILVNEQVIVELKAVEAIHPVYEAQLISYMKLLQVPQGLLINFFTKNIKTSMKPYVNEFFKALPE
jgi:GxxExxY protein